MIVDYINGRKTAAYFGTAKYSHEISKRLPVEIINRIEYPLLVPPQTRRWIYSEIFLPSYSKTTTKT